MIGRSKLAKVILLKIETAIFELLPEKSKPLARSAINHITEKLAQRNAYYSIAVIENNKAIINKTLFYLETLACEAQLTNPIQKQKLINLATILHLFCNTTHASPNKKTLLQQLSSEISILIRLTSSEDIEAILSNVKKSLESLALDKPRNADKPRSVTHWRGNAVPTNERMELFGDAPPLLLPDEEWRQEEEELAETDSSELSGYPQDVPSVHYPFRPFEPATPSPQKSNYPRDEFKLLLSKRDPSLRYTDDEEDKTTEIVYWRARASHSKYAGTLFSSAALEQKTKPSTFHPLKTRFQR